MFGSGLLSHKKFQVTVNFEKYSSRVSLGLLAYDYFRRLVGRIESWQRTGSKLTLLMM